MQQQPFQFGLNKILFVKFKLMMMLIAHSLSNIFYHPIVMVKYQPVFREKNILSVKVFFFPSVTNDLKYVHGCKLFRDVSSAVSVTAQ